MWILGLLLDLSLIVIIIFVVRPKFWKRALLIASFTLTLTQIASWITSTDFFSLYVYPENLALQDFDLTDYAIANLREPAAIDNRITIVNIGVVSRREIAREIQILSKYHPRVIGLDAFFNCEEGKYDSISCPQASDTIGNKMFSDALRLAGNMVLSMRLTQKVSTSDNEKLQDVQDSIEYSDYMFNRYATNGFSNLPVHEGFSEQINLIRELVPVMKVNGKSELAFAVEVARRYDSTRSEEIIARNKSLEIINFRRNIDLNKLESKFDFIDIDELLSHEQDSAKLSALIKDRIVLMGYVGSSYGDQTIEGVFYTPFNKITYGRSLPDMFGIVLHANIVSMILDNDYIDEVSEIGEIFIGFLTCVFHVALLLFINKKMPRWFEVIAIGLVVLQLFLGSWLRLTLFIHYNIKMQLYFTMASLAIASISINLCKELFHLIQNKLPDEIRKRL